MASRWLPGESRIYGVDPDQGRAARCQAFRPCSSHAQDTLATTDSANRSRCSIFLPSGSGSGPLMYG
jgi:hypothetical protein